MLGDLFEILWWEKETRRSLISITTSTHPSPKTRVQYSKASFTESLQKTDLRGRWQLQDLVWKRSSGTAGWGNVELTRGRGRGWGRIRGRGRKWWWVRIRKLWADILICFVVFWFANSN